MDKIWKFDGSMKEMPPQNEILKSVEKVGYENIILDQENKTVFLKKKGIKIGFGALGKGYAADKAKSLLIEKGVVAGIINASGDLNAWGKQPNGKNWKIILLLLMLIYPQVNSIHQIMIYLSFLLTNMA